MSPFPGLAAGPSFPHSVRPVFMEASASAAVVYPLIPLTNPFPKEYNSGAGMLLNPSFGEMWNTDIVANASDVRSAVGMRTSLGATAALGGFRDVVNTFSWAGKLKSSVLVGPAPNGVQATNTIVKM